MRDPENIREVAAMSPQYMGFIFYKGSKRFVGNDFTIPDDTSIACKRVGVFVNQSIKEILSLANRHQLDFIQLHGKEAIEECRSIYDAGLGVIKSFGVGKGFDFSEVNRYKGFVDYFLFDAKGDGHGGNGVPFDWSALHGYDQDVPFFLSGGISPDHVEEIKKLRGMNLHALDVNSKVEKRIGLKDIELVRKLSLLLAE